MFELFNNDISRAVLAFCCSLLISSYAIPIIIHVARLKNLYDMPNGRTSHYVKTPTLGGVAIFSSFIISLGLFINPLNFPNLHYFLAAITIVFFIGLKDDLLHISALKKLVAQLLAAFIITVLADIRISNFQGFLGITELNYYFSVFISIITIVGLINGFNLIDGIDGLASGIGILTSLTFGIWFAMADEWQYFILSLSLAGSLFAFFRYNVFSKKKKLFMGDTGSLILGFAVSVLMIHFVELNIPGTAKASVASAPAIALGILVIPLFDTLQVMIIRMLRGKSPFKPDKTHLHHFILRLGFSHFQSTLLIIVANISIIIFSFSFQSLGIHVLSALFAALFIMCAVIMSIIQKRLEAKAIEELQPKKSLESDNTLGIKRNGSFRYKKSDLENILKKYQN